MTTSGAIVREIRRRADISLREFARRARTSHSTLAAYESGTKEPALSTVERLAAGVDLSVRWRVEDAGSNDRSLTRQELRSLLLHLDIARQLLEAPCRTRRRGTEQLERMEEAHGRGRAGPYLAEWRLLLEGPMNELLDALTSTDERARTLRPLSPFAAMVARRRRQEILERTSAGAGKGSG